MSNQTFDISVASSRHTKTWAVEQWTWPKFVAKVKNTHRTSETFTEYQNSPKPRQAEIKDVGGFVGGYLIDGQRHKHTVNHRQLVVLDLDDAYPDLFEDVIMFYSNALCLYSTHASSVVAPRMRLCMPLDRPVTPEEYEAIARRIAGDVGTKHVCQSSFQIHQLMYWPSTAKDGDFYFRQQDGAWLCADSVLAEYRDWTNVAEWPLCPTEHEIVRSDLKKCGDPCEKNGVVGAFCRVYSISEVIDTFLSHVYTACEYGDRYTYEGGSTNGGAIVYDDKFLYSHHSTDPASGILCNAFDLMRIHKFGHEDTDQKKVSLGLAMNLATTDPKVVHELGIFNLDKTITEGGETEWLDAMDVDKKGNYLCTIHNFLLILRNDPNMKGKFSYNEFDYRIYAINKKVKTALTDTDEADLRLYFENKYGIYHSAKAQDAFSVAAHDNAFHPVRDYLASLQWDGVPRLDTLFIDQLGVANTEYTRAVTRKCLCAAVARVREPGCKFDYMVVAIGAQGKGKSSLLSDLGGEWFSDTLDSVTGKEAYMQIQGAWLLEMAELSSIKRAEVEATKHFITKREDRFRIPFAKHNSAFKRQMVPFGSTNEITFLMDKTGNRRFWPLVVGRKYKPGTIDRDPIWAEAVYRYEQGEELYLSDRLEAMAVLQQSEHTEQDERTGMIEQFINMPIPPEWEEMSKFDRIQYYSTGDYSAGVKPRDRVCAAEIWVEVFKGELSQLSAYNTKFIHTAMTQFVGWSRAGVRSYKKYGNQRSYVRTGSVEAADVLEEQKEFKL